MIDEFRLHNLFLQSVEAFERDDPHLSSLHGLPIVHPLDWWRGLGVERPGVFILTGGRQIGKSTSTKLLIRHALRDLGLPAAAILYLPCDSVVDHVHLVRILRHFLDSLPDKALPFLLVVDEVTFVKEWPRAIKALADEGRFRRGICVITGSDTALLRDAALAFPGRRGESETADFHLMPIPFGEYAELAEPALPGTEPARAERLHVLFRNYLVCGGYLRAINDLHAHGEVRPATYATFEQWVRGDFLKRGRSEATLLSVLLQAILDVGVSQVSYSGLTGRVGTVGKETVMDYCGLLERMDVLLVLQAYDQNRHRGSPKKARKFHFVDPFIRGTIRRWLAREGAPAGGDDEAPAVEACVAAHLRRAGPVYYFKGHGEIDAVSLAGGRPSFIEVKWSDRVRLADLAQLARMKEGVVLTRDVVEGAVEGVPAVPTPSFLHALAARARKSRHPPGCRTDGA
ncbi:MAG: ATP-binding protein [Deltaproteobacteria bacterium]|nr:ATP-binding protein [Deltaproteobacteria bacterium]